MLQVKVQTGFANFWLIYAKELHTRPQKGTATRFKEATVLSRKRPVHC